MKLKDFKPKYNDIELIVDDKKEKRGKKIVVFGFYFGTLVGFYDFKKAVELFGERELLSVKDYDDTRSTSIIVSKESAKA